MDRHQRRRRASAIDFRKPHVQYGREGAETVILQNGRLLLASGAPVPTCPEECARRNIHVPARLHDAHFGVQATPLPDPSPVPVTEDVPEFLEDDEEGMETVVVQQSGLGVNVQQKVQVPKSAIRRARMK